MTLAAPLAFLLLSAAPARADKAQGDLVKTIRVLVQNIYGRNENDCKKRYKALAKEILAASPPFDVVALNEHWSKPGIDRWVACDDTVLTKALQKDSDFAAKDHFVLHQPEEQAQDPEGTQTHDEPAFDTAGGNSVFSRGLMTDAYQQKFTNSRSIPLSGYVMTRIEAAPGVEFDLWAVHLEAVADTCNDECRWEQATDLASDVETYSGFPDKGHKGHPVLIVGDFNTGGPMSASDTSYAGNGGYANVMEALSNPRDLGLELGGGAGYTYDCDENKTQKCQGRTRIDYVLLPEAKSIVHPSAEHYFVPLKIEVVKWKTAEGVHVSDHYGLDVTLELRRRPS